MAEQDKDLVTWGTPESYQATGDISREPPIDLSSAKSAGAEDLFNLPPQQNPLSPAYTYQPSTPPNLANDPSMSGSGSVSLPPAPITGQPGGITRDNPFGGPPVPPPVAPNPSLNPVQPPATPASIAALPQPAPAPTGPLPTPQFNAAQIQQLEQRKDIVANQATNLSQGQAEAARIQREAAQQDRMRMEGDPQALLKAQQDHAAAMKLPDSDPNKRAALQQAEFNIRSNEGARNALLRAQMDAERRDNDIRQMIQKAQAQSIDPNRYWANKGTGGRIVAGIGMLLSGMGSGMTGQPNLAVQQLNNAIDRDIQAQRTDIDQSWKAIAEMKGLNDTTFNRELHRQVWENNYRTAALERVKLDLAANAAQTESQTVKNNAQIGIQDLTNEQLKIRNQQYLLGVAAQANELKRIRELQKEAQADVMKLVEKEGVSVEQAERTIYSSPRYADIQSRAPAHVQAEIRDTNLLKSQYIADMTKAEAGAKTLGLKPGTEQYKKYIEANVDSAKYQRLFTGERAKPIGTVVGPDAAKQLDIATKQEKLAETANEKKAMADVYGRAKAYQDYFGKDQMGITDLLAPPLTEEGVKKRVDWNNNINAWNTFVDTTLVPLMERKINAGKATEQSIKIGGERYHISPVTPLEKRKQIMQSAMDSLGEAMTISGVKTEGIPTGSMSGKTKPEEEKKTQLPDYAKPAGK